MPLLGPLQVGYLRIPSKQLEPQVGMQPLGAPKAPPPSLLLPSLL